MKLQAVLSKSRMLLFNTIRLINGIVRYLLTWKKRRLYQQWVDKGALSPEDVPQEEISQDIIARIDTEQLRLPMLYVILGASLVILLISLVILMVYSC